MENKRDWLDQYVAVATKKEIRLFEVNQVLSGYVAALNERLRGYQGKHATINVQSKRLALPNGELTYRVEGNLLTLKAVIDGDNETREALITNGIDSYKITIKDGDTSEERATIEQAIDVGLKSLLIGFAERYTE